MQDDPTIEIWSLIVEGLVPSATGRLLAELHQLATVITTQPGTLTSFDLLQSNPVPERALTDSERLGHVDDLAILVEHHRHRTLPVSADPRNHPLSHPSCRPHCRGADALLG